MSHFLTRILNVIFYTLFGLFCLYAFGLLVAVGMWALKLLASWFPDFPAISPIETGSSDW